MAGPATNWSAVQMQISGHIVDASGYNRPTVNLIQFANPGSTYSPVLATLQTNICAQLAAPWAAAFGSDWVCDQVTLRDLVHPTRLPAIFATPTNFTGTQTPPSGSTQESAFIQWRTLYRGKSFQGGTKLSPIPEAGVVDNHLTAGQIILYANIGVALLSAGPFSDGVNTYLPFLWSRKYSSLFPVADCIIAGQLIFSARVRKSTGTMKRRKPKGAY